jgi:peptidyl-prolyl cis-trans isomerase C
MAAMQPTCDAQRAAVAHVNGVPLLAAGEAVSPDELRQRACTELLRQAAIERGLLAEVAPAANGAASEEASAAIEALLEREVQVPEPDEPACRRYYEAHRARYHTGERVRLRHILFAVTPGTDVLALRRRAEACWIDVRAHDGSADDGFAAAAAKLSNCPSGATGGALGWLGADDCAPEFVREVFGHHEVGVLPRLVHSRFGLHVVEVLEREPGTAQPFEAVREAVARALKQQAWINAVRQYLQLLAGQAVVEGVQLHAAVTPLVQ